MTLEVERAGDCQSPQKANHDPENEGHGRAGSPRCPFDHSASSTRSVNFQHSHTLIERCGGGRSASTLPAEEHDSSRPEKAFPRPSRQSVRTGEQIRNKRDGVESSNFSVAGTRTGRSGEAGRGLYGRQAQPRQTPDPAHQRGASYHLCRALCRHGRHLLQARDTASIGSDQRRIARRRHAVSHPATALSAVPRYDSLAARQPCRPLSSAP